VNGDTAFIAGIFSADIIQLQWSPRRGESVEFPPLAHTLFRLQRFGVPAPRLVAIGWSRRQVVCAVKLGATIPFENALAAAPSASRRGLLRQAGRIVRQMHEAGYCLPAGQLWARRLGVLRATGEVALVQIEPLVRGETTWHALADKELMGETMPLTIAEQFCGLRGYLHGRGDPDARNWMRTILSKTARRERQVIS
jgi:hypothetical protein